MNRPVFKDHILVPLKNEPQRHAQAEDALKRIFEALDDLAKLGHSLQIVPDIGGNVQAHHEYPKMMYHDMFPGGAAVESAEVERQHRQQGWRDTPTAPEATGAGGKEQLDRKPWPRRFFHPNQAPEGKLVHSQIELEQLGPGWSEEAPDQMGMHDTGQPSMEPSRKSPEVPGASDKEVQDKRIKDQVGGVSKPTVDVNKEAAGKK